MVACFVAAALCVSRPADAAPPVISTFTQSVTDGNNVTLTWTSSGGDSSGLAYISGPKITDANGSKEDVGFVGQNGTKTFRAPAGKLRYVIEMHSQAGENMTKAVSVTATAPAVPTITSTNPRRIGLFAGSQSVTVTFDAPGADSVVVSGGPVTPSWTYASGSGSFTLTASQYASLPDGPSSWQVAACSRDASATPPWRACSQGALATIVKDIAHFDGNFRVIRPSQTSSSLSLTWSGAGSSWQLYLDDAPFGSRTTSQTATIPASALTTGNHRIELASCTSVRCSDEDVYKTSAAGTFTPAQVPDGQNQTRPLAVGDLRFAGQPIGTVGSTTITADQTGVVRSLHAAGAVSANDELARIDQGYRDVKEVIVGEGITWTSQSYSTDFTANFTDFDDHPATRTGFNQLAYNNGTVWAIGEFANAIGSSSSAGQFQPYDVPLLRKPQGTLLQPVRPFAYGTGRASVSIWGESVVTGDGKIFFSQGGKGEASNETDNHSRIVSFDPSASDTPDTYYDDRICVINVPGDNNGVGGLAWDGTRLWFVEGTGGSNGPSLSWLIPSQVPCGNEYDYDSLVDPASPAYCGGTGCVHRVALPGAFHPAQIAADPDGTHIWITDYYGGQIGRYDRTNGGLDWYPSPTPARPTMHFESAWKVEADADYVYYTGFADTEILRLDKSKLGVSGCQTRQAVSPCIDTAHVPASDDDVTLLSLVLQPASGSQHGRLWFATSAGGFHQRETNSSTVGFIDTTTWASGTSYTGIAGAAPAAAKRVHPVTTGGLDRNPANGQIAVVSTAGILRLTP